MRNSSGVGAWIHPHPMMNAVTHSFKRQPEVRSCRDNCSETVHQDRSRNRELGGAAIAARHDGPSAVGCDAHIVVATTMRRVRSRMLTIRSANPARWPTGNHDGG